MAGHSHAKNVKRTKDADAKKRSLAFAKMGRNISLLAKQGGGDIDSNPPLRTMVEKAREMNVPKENIEKAIKKGTGELEGTGTLEEFIFEAYGPGGIAIIVEGITDNRNRSIAEFKKIMSQHDGKVAEPGSVKWMFKRKGSVTMECDDCDEAELIAIEMGAEEIKKIDGILKVVTGPEDTDRMKRGLEGVGFKADSSLEWVASNTVVAGDDDKKRLNSLFEELDSNEDIQEIYSNIER